MTMGLFDGLKVAKDIIQGGIEAAKACEKLDEAVKKSIGQYDKLLSEKERKLYLDYKMLLEKKDNLKDTEKQNDMSEEVEAAEIAYLVSLQTDLNFPKEFRNEIKAAVDGYKQANSQIMERIQKRMLSMAKTEEEKAELRKQFESVN